MVRDIVTHTMLVAAAVLATACGDDDSKDSPETGPQRLWKARTTGIWRYTCWMRNKARIPPPFPSNKWFPENNKNLAESKGLYNFVVPKSLQY